MAEKRWVRKLVLNEHLDVVLDENGRTWILLDGEIFLLCKRLVLNIHLGEAPKYDNITSIDDAVEQHATLFMGRGYEPAVREISITPEEEYFGHCSNLQAWVDHGYDTRILHANISFNLLRGLAEVGDEKAARVLEGELADRAKNASTMTATAMLATFSDKKLPAAVFNAFASNSEVAVRLLATKQLNLPASAMEVMATDKDVAVRRSIAERLDLPDNVAARMAKDTDASVRFNITKLSKLVEDVEISYDGKKITTVRGSCELLNLSGRNIERIPDINGLDKLVNLKTLVLSENRISRIEGLEPLVTLEKLSLGHNRISRIEGVDTLVHLKTLAIPQNQITTIEGLDRLTSLSDLRLYDNQITRIQGLGALTKLGLVFLYKNKIARIEGLDQLHRLQSLNLSDNQITRIEGIDSNMLLYALELSGNQIECIEGINICTFLGMLNLADNRIRELRLEELGGFTYLRSVSFAGNVEPFSPAGWVAWPLRKQ